MEVSYEVWKWLEIDNMWYFVDGYDSQYQALEIAEDIFDKTGANTKVEKVSVKSKVIREFINED